MLSSREQSRETRYAATLIFDLEN